MLFDTSYSVKNKLIIKPIVPSMIPKYRQFLALIGSSLRNTKYVMMPPINPKNIGKIYHQLLLFFI